MFNNKNSWKERKPYNNMFLLDKKMAKETLTLVCIICYDFFEVYDSEEAKKFVRCPKCREQGKLLE